MRYSSEYTCSAVDTCARAIKILQEYYVTEPQIKGFVSQLAMLD